MKQKKLAEIDAKRAIERERLAQLRKFDEALKFSTYELTEIVPV